MHIQDSATSPKAEFSKVPEAVFRLGRDSLVGWGFDEHFASTCPLRQHSLRHASQWRVANSSLLTESPPLRLFREPSRPKSGEPECLIHPAKVNYFFCFSCLWWQYFWREFVRICYFWKQASAFWFIREWVSDIGFSFFWVLFGLVSRLLSSAGR